MNSLYQSILLINLEMDGKSGFRMLYVRDENFTKEDAFNWAKNEADKVEGIITDFKIV